ncbi:hypothetical protein SAMN05421776_11781 [Nocardia farcinica]|uniref:Uncharacterized protein n=1 Tax=Nocardia farcinica TaxID=37329 RepID=A0A0H5NXU8_NOCFR|nr:hypothetical protein [Nocardia farcinica]PFW99083.1 hypothetical protein CJ469_05689 [Nocardia farcinica]PFX06121.1 hypothetical protein CJ468_04987 [Nocardia farcinica]CRY79869.1 Uncharacterised protein [Nocardia farcinica]SIT33690.1 hypothetical protein SAMN05421776_11781 [Nocardia farcinica]
MRFIRAYDALDGYRYHGHRIGFEGGMLLYSDEVGAVHISLAEDDGFLVSIYPSGGRCGHYWVPAMENARNLGRRLLALAGEGYDISGRPPVKRERGRYPRHRKHRAVS